MLERQLCSPLHLFNQLMNSVKCDKIVEKGIQQVKLKDKEKSGKSPADSSFCKGALTIE